MSLNHNGQCSSKPKYDYCVKRYFIIVYHLLYSARILKHAFTKAVLILKFDSTNPLVPVLISNLIGFNSFTVLTLNLISATL